MLQILNMGQRLDGDMDFLNGSEHYFQATSGTYVGGQPVGIGPSGLIFGTDLGSSCCSLLGAFRNNSLQDTRVGAGEVVLTTDLTKAKPTICYPGNKIKVWQDSEKQGDASAPYENLTYAIGDDLYVSSNGLWTNVSSTGCTQSWGKVLLPPTTYGDPLVFEFNSYAACTA